MDIPREERRKRIEAARAFAGISNQDELGKRLGYKPPKFRRHLAGDGGDIGIDELLRIAEVCEVPAWFMLAGWDGAIERDAGTGPGALTGAAEELEEATERLEETGRATGTEGADG